MFEWWIDLWWYGGLWLWCSRSNFLCFGLGLRFGDFGCFVCDFVGWWDLAILLIFGICCFECLMIWCSWCGTAVFAVGVWRKFGWNCQFSGIFLSWGGFLVWVFAILILFSVVQVLNLTVCRFRGLNLYGFGDLVFLDVGFWCLDLYRPVVWVTLAVRSWFGLIGWFGFW